ncbi:2-hydroxyglutaryl-CoA dehydratase [Candidatus Acetothermia bacterium]|nr:2-hydroxyglutaryl-CoA dehydratase [Candidatus Acetothermia bacterium]
MLFQEEYVAGVDVGSTQAKAVILNEAGEITGRGLGDVKGNVSQAAREVFDMALINASLREDDIAYVIGTGYGRFRIAFGDAQITEISCHTRGARHLFPNTRTVIDIGGQDTKAIRTGRDGNVLDFTMNDKCSAGTGRFLGAAAMVLEIPLPELGPLALASQNPVKITTTCTVFAESEIISYVAKGKKTEDILMGMHESIAQRTISLAQRVGIEDELTFTGGVSRNPCMVKLLEQFLGMKLNVSSESQYIGAIGAALFALERIGGHVSEKGMNA